MDLCQQEKNLIGQGEKIFKERNKSTFPFFRVLGRRIEEMARQKGKTKQKNSQPTNQPTKKKPEMEARGSKYPEKKLFMIQMELRM